MRKNCYKSCTIFRTVQTESWNHWITSKRICYDFIRNKHVETTKAQVFYLDEMELEVRVCT